MQNAASSIPKSCRSPRKTTTLAESFKATTALRRLVTCSVVLVAFGFSALSLRAAEPILTLAMVNYGSLPGHPFQFAPDQFSISASPSVSVSAKDILVEPINLSITEDTFPTSVLSLESRHALTSAGSLLLTRKNLREDHRWNRSRFQPGFGQIFYDKTASVYGRNGTGWEEPWVGYLKIRFHF
jgi:hypothetical protein